MKLELTPVEERLLRDLLTRHLGDLRVEIVRTDRYEARQDLKRDEVAIKALLERLGTTVA